MRISNQMQNHMMTGSIQQNQAAVYDMEKEIASGKKINQASEDPNAWSRIARLRQQMSELSGYAENTQAVELQLISVDHSLGLMGEVLQGASEIAVQGGDGTLADVNREALAEQVDQLIEQLLVVSNSKYNGQYQFGGVQSSMEPYVATRNDAGQVVSVEYQGSEFSAMIEVAPGDALPKQLVGSAPDNGILNSDAGDAFGILVDLRDQLAANQNLAETDMLEQVNTVMENVLVSRASIGAYIEHVSLVSEMHAARELSLAENISDMEDIDMAEAVTELSAKQTAYEASLAMASKTLNMSLLKYL